MMKPHKVEIFTKGHKLAVTYTADAEIVKCLVEANLTNLAQHQWVTFHQDDETVISIRVSEIESVKVTPL